MVVPFVLHVTLGVKLGMTMRSFAAAGNSAEYKTIKQKNNNDLNMQILMQEVRA